jgi:hypothetical protein
MHEQFDRRMLLGAAGLAGVAALTKMAQGGDLNPPPGPISPTMKPLDQIEPRIVVNSANTPGNATATFRITQPGSYYLTGNITGESGKNGIEIVASGVTLDLMGFDLAGVPGSLDGIRTAVNNLLNISILNGSVRNWGGEGINLRPFQNSKRTHHGCAVQWEWQLWHQIGRELHDERLRYKVEYWYRYCSE